MMLGIFMVNATHRVDHIVSSVIFLIASMLEGVSAGLWFQIFGVVYAILAILGFMNLNGILFGIITNNPANRWRHAGLAVVMLIIGFAMPKNGSVANQVSQ